MPPHTDIRPTEITVIVVAICLLVLLPPLLDWWGASKNVWYAPYLVWSGIIALTYCLQRLLKRNAV